MALNLGELVAIISADDSRFRRVMGGVHRSLQQVGRVGALTALAGAASTAATALGPAAAGVASLGISLGAAIAPAAGLAVALPGVAVAWKASLAIMQLAVEGLSDTLGAAITGDMEKFREELKKLPPAARTVAGELGGALAGLQQMVQSAFFAPIAAQSKGLGRQLRVPIVLGATAAASAMGRVGARVVAVAREGRSIAFIRNVFAAISQAIDRAAVGAAPLLRGLRDIAGVGLGLLPRIGTEVGELATRMGEWLQKIVASGQAVRWLKNGIATALRLGRILRNIGATIGAVFRAGNISSGNMLKSIERLTAAMAAWSRSASGQSRMAALFARGRLAAAKLGVILKNLGIVASNVFKQAGAGAGDLLGSLVVLSQRLAEWSSSAEGQQQLAQFFNLLNQTAQQLVMILPILGGALGLVASIIGSMPPGVQGAVTQFLAWAVVLGFVTSRIGPLLTGVGLLGKGLFKLGGAVANPQSRLRQFASRVGSAFTTAGRGLARAGAAAGRTAASFMLAAGRMGLAAGRAALSVALAGARMAGSMALAAGRVVAGWVLMGVQSLIQAARMAAAWLIAMGPVGWIVAAAIGAVALIIANWDKVVKFFTKTLPKWIRQGATFVGNLIKNMARYGFLGPIGLIISHWGKISTFFTKTLPSTVSRGISTVIGWLQRLPGRVVSALGDMGKLLVNAGKSLLIGFWNGMVSMANWLARSIGNLIRRIVPGPVLRVLGIASPSKLFAGYGKNVAEGMALGMTRNASLVEGAAGALAHAAGVGGAAPVSRPAPVGARAGAPATGSGGTVRVILDTQGADAEMHRLMRKLVRVKGRGNVQVAFGSR